MASKPYEIPWNKVNVGMLIAVERRGGFAWRLADVEHHPNQYDWRVVTGKDHEGPLIHIGGVGVNGRTVVVRDLPPADQRALAALVQHLRNAALANDRQSVDQLRRQIDRRIATIT